LMNGEGGSRVIDQCLLKLSSKWESRLIASHCISRAV
jgi:hypothetical protein